MPITYRLVKGSALTYSELDGNFTALSQSVSSIVAGDVNYIPVFNTSTSLSSSIMYQALGNLHVNGGLSVANTVTSPKFIGEILATGSVTASITNNETSLFSITYNGYNYGRIDLTNANTSFGPLTLKSTATGTSNTALGYYTLNSLTNGSSNTALGNFTLVANNTGELNTAVGSNALFSNTRGGQNTAIGVDAGGNNVSGTGSVFIGYQAGFNETTSNKLYIANSSTATPLIKGDFFSGSIQFTTPGKTQITGSLIVSEGITGSLFGSASYALVAQTLLGTITSASFATTASFLLGSVVSSSYALNADLLDGIDSTRFAVTSSNRFNGNQTITGSFLASGSGHSFVGTLNITGSLFVSSSVSASTLGQFTGNNNGYVEFSVRNTNGGVSASGDIAVYADNGTILNNYIDMGINNSGLSNTYFYGGTDFGNANDAYLYNVGGNLRIGNATSTSPSQSVYIFSNTAANPDISITGSRVGIQKSSGSLNATLDVTGSVLISGSLTVSGSSLLSRLTTQTSNYTLALSDLGNIIEMSSSTANTVTIPSSSTVRFPIPAEIQVLQWGSGQTQILAASTNVFTGSYNSYNKIGARYTGVTLLQRALDQWYIVGNLST
jgi:hypothetical protein